MDKGIEETLNSIKHIIENLRTKLLCQICSEVMLNSLEINCGHKFCEGCFTAYAGNKKRIHCPVCKQYIKKQPSYGRDSYGDALGKFVAYMSNLKEPPLTINTKPVDPDNMKENTIPHVEPAKPPKKNKEVKSFEDSKKRVGYKQNDLQNTKKSNVPDVEPEPAESSNKNEMKSFEDSKNLKAGQDLLRASKKRNDQQQNCGDSNNHKLHDNTPGDTRILKENNIPSIVPAKFSRRNEIKSFEESMNRKVVQDWLCSTQNMFNRMTQTQLYTQHDEQVLLSLSQLSLPSVSQRNPPRPATKKTRALSLDSKDNLTRRRSDVLKVIDNYGIEDFNLKEQQVVQQVRETVLNKVRESEFLNELEEEFKGIENNIGNVLLDQLEEKEKETPRKSKTSPGTNTGGWERLQEITRNIKCSRATPKKLNVTVKTSQDRSSKRLKKNSPVLVSPVKESHVADLKSKNQHLNVSSRKLNSSMLQPTYLSTSSLDTVKAAEDILYLVPTQKIDTDHLNITENDPNNFIEDLDLTFEDKLRVFEDQLKHNNLRRMFHEIMDFTGYFRTFDKIQKADASVQTKQTTTCKKQTQTAVYSKSIAIQCIVESSNAQIQTDQEGAIPEEILANSLDNLIFDTEDFIGKKNKKPSQNLKNPDIPESKNAVVDVKPSTSGIKRPIRRNSSNSDEDVKPVKKKNRFLKEDLSIEFASTAQVESLETCATEAVHCNEHVKEMNHESESPIVQKKPAWDKCDDVIANVFQNVNKLAKNKVSEEPESDATSGSEPLEPAKKKHMPEKLQTGNKQLECIVPTQKCNNHDNKKENGNALFDDDFDDELGKIEIPNTPRKINIISNIPIERMEAEDDLFSDDDVINATPPRIQNSDELNTVIDLFDTTIPPPLDFQDVPKQIETQQIIDRKLDHSTPLSGINSVPESVNLSPISHKNIENTFCNKMKETPKRSGSLNIMSSIRNQQSMWNFINTSSQTILSPTQQNVKPCIACSRLNSNQIIPILNLTNRKLATYTASFTDDVTHLIVGPDLSEVVTIKFILAVASGIWVLKHDWIIECLAQNRIVPEEPYESLDDKGGTGPKTARLKAKTDPLFKDFKFYFYFNKPSGMEDGITKAVIKLGGSLYNKVVNMTEKDGKVPLIVVEDRMSQTDLFQRWSELYNIAIVDLEWLGVCIARYRMVGILSYTSYPADTLREWKYPNCLLFNED